MQPEKNDVVEVVIEIPYRARNKYEEDEETGRIRLDRVLYSAMGYPTEYGLMEHTLAPDGDPLDFLVIGTEPTYPGCIVPARIIGYLEMIDGGSPDYKVLSVVDCDPRYDNIHDLSNVSSFQLDEIRNFFENYKRLQNVEVEVRGYHTKEEALKLVESAKAAYQAVHAAKELEEATKRGPGFKFAHYNFNVKDLDKSLEFYGKALGLTEARRKEAEDGSYIIVFLEDGVTDFRLELTWMRDWEKECYDLGDNEMHLGITVANFEAAHLLHSDMGCICLENEAMGIYFIEDPDGYWIEIVPEKR